MAGAYTAKPEDTPAAADLPPGWNVDWPYPGPFPPGYEPDLLLSLTAPATIFYTTGSAGGVATSLTDQVTYGTAEPGDQLSWTATIGGTSVGIKLSGEESFSSAILMSYIEISELWGSLSDLVFDIGASDAGATINLVVSSTPFIGHRVSASADIFIAADVPVAAYIIYTSTVEGAPDSLLTEVVAWTGSSVEPFDPNGWVYLVWIEGTYDAEQEYINSEDPNFVVSHPTELVGRIDISLTSSTDYWFSVNCNWLLGGGPGGEPDVTYTLKLYTEDDQLIETFTRILSTDGTKFVWMGLSFDENGDYTVT